MLLKPLMALIWLEDIVYSVCPLASNRASVSVGEVCKILVLNGLNSPQPLYKIQDWADQVSAIDLFGIPSDLINDDKPGRCLELLAAYSDDIEAFLCLRLIRDFGVPPKLVIWDSTSFYFKGAYDDSEFVTFGYDVEGITNTKRVNVEISIDADTGVPLVSGRKPDKRDNTKIVIDNLETLKATLAKADRTECVVVAGRAPASVEKRIPAGLKTYETRSPNRRWQLGPGFDN